MCEGAYLIPSCYSQIDWEFHQRLQNSKLRNQVRGVYEILGLGFSDKRVHILDRYNWIVMLDLTVDEYFHSEPVKRVMVRYPIRALLQHRLAEKSVGSSRWTVSHRRCRSWGRLNHECPLAADCPHPAGRRN